MSVTIEEHAVGLTPHTHNSETGVWTCMVCQQMRSDPCGCPCHARVS